MLLPTGIPNEEAILGSAGAGAGGALGVPEGGDVEMQQHPAPQGGEAQQGELVESLGEVVQPELPQRLEPVQHDESVEIAGVKVLPTSTVATLRAACEYLQISRSGSKAKLRQRITACIDKQKLHEAVQISEQMRAEKERACLLGLLQRGLRTTMRC